MQKKVLFCATVDYHFKAFHIPYLKWFKEQGWEVHIAASGNMELPFVDQKYHIPIQRSPLNIQNINAFHALKSIMDRNTYNIIHCHTPMGGVLARLAAFRARKKGTKLIYTAHGFHFFKGASFLNWLIYYPIEKALVRFTDCLITINEEDYALALQHRFKAKRIAHVHGVGVDTERFRPVDEAGKRELRRRYGYKTEDFLLIYAAEFNKNKNQQLLIRTLALIKPVVPHARLLLAGDGRLLEECRLLAKQLEVERMVDFLGHRDDLEQLLPMCDVAVASSIREGLPVNIMEAMACGLPVLASDNRGHRELISNKVNGYLIPVNDCFQCALRLLELSRSKVSREAMGIENVNKIKRYAIPMIRAELSDVYTPYMVGDEDETQGQYYCAHL